MTIAGVVILSVVCARPPAVVPFTSREVESAWGEAVGGLSVAFALDAAAAPMGAEVRAEVFFRYVPFLAGAVPHELLPTSSAYEACDLVFRDAESGREHVRHAYRAPIATRPVAFGVIEQGLHRHQDRFHTVACDGEPVPAGRYDVWIRYSNGGDRPLGRPVVARPGTEPPGNRAWAGIAESGSVPFTVLPASPERVTCRLPTAIVLEVNPRTARLEWSWAPESWRDVEVVRRPGHWLRVDWREWVTLDGEELPSSPDSSPEARREHDERWGWRGMASTWLLDREWDREGIAVLGPRFREVVGADRPVRVDVRMSLVQAPSRWGDCSDEHALPAEWEHEASATWSGGR